jgi:hypothetical protein
VTPGSSTRLRELQQLVAAWRGPGTLVLVSHALTVRALLGFLPLQGETAVLKPAPGTPTEVALVSLIAPPSP